MKKILLSLFVVLMMLSCDNSKKYVEKVAETESKEEAKEVVFDKEKVAELESKAFANRNKFDKEVVAQLVDAYLLFANQNPDDVNSPDFIFRALNCSVGMGIGGPQKAIDIANILIEQYPDFEMTPMALFIKGYVYENMLGDLQNAEATYHQFIEKYPDNPMIGDVKATLDNLGLTPEELVRKFEEANK